MNLVKALAREHSRAQCTRIVRYVGNDPKRFATLIQVFLDGPYRLTQRAAWPLNYCVEAHPKLVEPHLRKIIRYMQKPGVHDAVRRNTLRMLQFVAVPRPLQGLATEVSFNMLRDVTQPVAVRVFAMSVLGNLARAQPGLKRELMLLIEDQLPYASAGFLSRARRVLKELSH